MTASVASRLLRLSEDTAAMRSPRVRLVRRRGLFMLSSYTVFRASPDASEAPAGRWEKRRAD